MFNDFPTDDELNGLSLLLTLVVVGYAIRNLVDPTVNAFDRAVMVGGAIYLLWRRWEEYRRGEYDHWLKG